MPRVSQLFERGFRRNRAAPLPILGAELNDPEGNTARFSLAVTRERISRVRHRREADRRPVQAHGGLHRPDRQSGRRALRWFRYHQGICTRLPALWFGRAAQRSRPPCGPLWGRDRERGTRKALHSFSMRGQTKKPVTTQESWLTGFGALSPPPRPSTRGGNRVRCPRIDNAIPPHRFSPMSSNHSSSVRTVTPNSFAFASLEPALGPATT